MLIFIGLGINPPKSITLEGVQAARDSSSLYLETYTSPAPKALSDELSSLIGKEVKTISRVMLEDGRGILNQATREVVSLFVFGDPMIATTHSDLRNRAIKMGIETRIIHSSSVLPSVIDEVGLHIYKFGKIATVTRQVSVPLVSIYNTIYENLLRGLHSLLLLEYDASEDFFLSPPEAFLSLLETEKDQGYGVISNQTFSIVCSKIGMKGQSIKCGTLKQMVNENWGEPPHSIIIPGELHFTEEESLKASTGQIRNDIPNNARQIQRRSHAMISKYVPKTLRALQTARELAKQKDLNLESVFENVELYAADAKRFLNEGKEELAILSIGYAEGLLDSLRFTDRLKLEW